MDDSEMLNFFILISPIYILNIKFIVKLEKSSSGVLLESLALTGNSHLYTSSNFMFIVRLVPWNWPWLEFLYQASQQGNTHWDFFFDHQLLNIYQHTAKLYKCCFAPKMHTHILSSFFSKKWGQYIFFQHWLSGVLTYPELAASLEEQNRIANY